MIDRELSARSFALIFLAVACSACHTSPPPLAAGIDLAGMDKSIAPGDDFNEYSNGGWAKATPIPADKASYGSGAILNDETRTRLRTMIEDAAKNASAGADTRKIGDYYASYMDEAGIEAKGTQPLKPRLDAAAAVADKHSLARAIGATLRADVDVLNNTNLATPNLFGVWVTQGLVDPSHSYPYLLQGGLLMPDRDYYVSPSPHMADLRKQYQSYMVAMFQLAGLSDPEARAARVFALETKMAAVHATRVASEDVKDAVNWKRAELDTKAPGLDWTALLDAAGLSQSPEFIVWQPKAITGLSALVAKEPLDAWKDWLALHAIDDEAPFLPKAFVEARFQFVGKALTGVSEMRPRWQRGVDLTSNALGDVVGKAYAQQYFPAETKAKVQAMVSDIIKAFGARIDALSWMTPETKTKAKRKLETLKVGVGYPDRWADYSGLEIVKSDPVGNEQRVDLFRYHQQLAKLQQPVDRGEWWMTPQTVNAVNLPLQNALNFPAAIIQPPYFDAQADAAHNYGSMGAIIGHEISHSFDDQGSQFDADGRLANWWTKDDFAHFEAACKGLAAQFDTYRPFPDLTLNGMQTLSENVADLAGLLASYDAYRISLAGRADETKDGLTGDQRFFISYAQSWRTKMRDAELRRRIAIDGHAPGQYRAETVRNLDAWYSAFSVPAGQKLYLVPEQRVRIW